MNPPRHRPLIRRVAAGTRLLRAEGFNHAIGNSRAHTQDNGTFDWESQLTTWDEEIYGDGGQSGYNYADDTIRFNTFFAYYTDENFRGGQPDKWVVTSGPLSSSNNGENVPFYMAIVSDYTNYGFQYAGLQHVWRTVDNGGQQAYLEANCPEFTASGDDPACGDWRPLGDPTYAGPGNLEAGKPGDLTSTVYGTRAGGVVVAVERSPGDNVTLWAATSNGRVFVSHNANSPDSGAVTFCRVDQFASLTAPPRFVTSIYPDPANANHAWISYSGYNQATPAFVGHAFEVAATGADQAGCPVGATWRDLGVEKGSNAHFFPGDIPVTDLVRDDLTGDIYAATDFGVLRSAGGAGFNWTKAGTNLPYVEVAGLTIDPCSRALYGATHGRSIWRMFLPAAAGAPSSACPRTP